MSEEIAYEGVSENIFTLVNNIELRPICNVLISRCNAQELLETFKPTLESVSARYYELILNSSEYSGYTDNIYLSEFHDALLSTTTQATAILVNINDKNVHNALSDHDTLSGKYYAGETPVKSPNKVEAMGLVAFNGDKLVGELNETDTVCHLILTNKLETAIVTMPSPFHDNSNISLSIALSNNTKNSVELINDFPFIKSNVHITANVTSMDYHIDLSKRENLILLEEYLEKYLKENILNYLYKTSIGFQADIVGFGKYIMPHYLTWDNWTKDDWLNNYQNSTFKVDINANVESGYLYTKI